MFTSLSLAYVISAALAEVVPGLTIGGEEDEGTATFRVPFAISILVEVSIVGVSLCAGGGSFDAGGSFLLTNAIDFTIGTF